ncbi:urease accessory protein UreF [Trichodelitschia bisporula]|uniref:Urease accessory protein UreF n=1 Tax=Trichodelitschia bisporula TaxID=703511 RepID=A0A6G1I779_9PEZI|nr:urease accessory protein UreF [Trichodelitschia bisporula]
MHRSPPPTSTTSNPPTTTSTAALHTLLLLSDSALPLGSFAFSSGLESYLAHHRPPPPQPLNTFLPLSLRSLASTSLPYLRSAHRDPSLLTSLDNDLDASTLCPVARRASTAQGRALLGVWERSLRAHHVGSEDDGSGVKALKAFSAQLRASAGDAYPAAGHFAPVWGVVTRVMGVGEREAGYVFLFAAARAVVSAAVRASVMGPYEAQGVLAGRELGGLIEGLLGEFWDVQVEGAGQSVPAVDLWVGRHEVLYSRIFNS